LDKCFACKKFDLVSKTMGICADTGEKVGINNGCSDCVTDKTKQENIMKVATRLYFYSGMNMKEAIERAIEFYE